jgi:uncharacterized protein (TIGR00369 family)
VKANDEVVRGMIVGSPLATLLRVAAESGEVGRGRLRLPDRTEGTTIGDTVHGGAIAALVDVAATAAVWSGADLSQSARGTTIGFSLSFLAAGRGQDLVATAEVIQRGRSVCVCEVRVEAADGKAVARALVTYKIG